MRLSSLFLSVSFLVASLTLMAQNEATSDTSAKLLGDPTDLKIFEKVDIEAKFPGGNDAWKNYLVKNLRANTPVDNGAPAGLYTVLVQFIVDREGKLSDIRPLTNFGYGMEQEVVRIIRSSLAWQPAMQNGRPVKAYRKQPVTFMIEEDGYKITSEKPYVLFSDVDNPLTIVARNIRSDDLQLTISAGTITPKGDGRYIIRVKNNPGRVILHLFNKKNKEIGSASFEVKDKNETKN